MKQDIFLHFATVNSSPVKTAEFLVQVMRLHGSEIGHWYAQLIYDSDYNEYDVCNEISDLKGETDLLSRIRKNGTGSWDLYTNIFNNENLYINVFPASKDGKRSSVIIHVAGNTSDGELAKFLQAGVEYNKREQQLTFFEQIALTISAEYYGIWTINSIFLPLDPNRLYSDTNSIFFMSWKQGTLDEKLIMRNHNALKRREKKSYLMNSQYQSVGFYLGDVWHTKLKSKTHFKK